MASSAFSKIAATVGTSKNLETILPGAPVLDDSAPHDVTILGVDISKLEDENKVDVIFGDEHGKQHREQLFVLDQDEQGLSFGFRWLLAGCIPSNDALKTFLKVAEQNPAIIEAFTGMKMRITLEYGKGIKAHALANGTFVGFDPAIVDEQTGQMIPQTAEHPDVKSVYTEVKATGKKRSYLRVQRIEATNKEENLAAFATAVEALQAAK